MHLDDELPTGAEYAQLVDLARGYGDQYTSMFVVRTAAQKGFVLPDRGYPVRTNPPSTGLETALVFGITRQESGFDPMVRSSADARGMMQLLPSTAQVVARRLGIAYSASMSMSFARWLGTSTTFSSPSPSQPATLRRE